MEKRVRVMVVDENNDFRQVCGENLKKLGYEVIAEAGDGVEAITKVQKFKPDCVLLDIWLARADGCQVIREIGKLIPESKPAFIILTAVNNQNMIQEANAAGAAYCMLKPFDYNLLADRINRACQMNVKSSVAGGNLLGQQSAMGMDLEHLDIESQVTKVIHQLGVPAHIKGYQYLRTAIIVTVKDNNIINHVTKILYPSVAKQYQTTSSRVERAIRHAIEVAWDRGDVETLNEFFGYTVHNTRGKPTNSEFIAMIADNLRLKNKIS